MKSQRHRVTVTATARIDADLIDRAHRRAGELRAAGDREATVTSVLSEWAARGADQKDTRKAA